MIEINGDINGRMKFNLVIKQNTRHKEMANVQLMNSNNTVFMKWFPFSIDKIREEIYNIAHIIQKNTQRVHSIQLINIYEIINVLEDFLIDLDNHAEDEL